MTDSSAAALLRSIPAMDGLLREPWAAGFLGALGRGQVKSILAGVLAEIRREIRSGALESAGPAADMVRRRAAPLLRLRASSATRSVVNATGVVIHTNLGRAPLGEAAIQAVIAAAGTYSALEYSPETGERGGRGARLEGLLCRAAGSEAALVVNNNAAAVLLALSALAAGREVIVSNGELVEIGGSFRIPDILACSGAKMVAVGCTNSTRVSDYRNAVTDQTAALLKVHPSNYRITGFAAAVSREELAELAASRGLAFLEDLGSGLLSPLGPGFSGREPLVKDCLAAGADAVTFSGDKLLGGPQAGVIAGSKRLLDKMRAHPLFRAARVDKMTLAAFEATARLHLAGRQGELPAIRLIQQDGDALLKKARSLLWALQRAADALGRSDYGFSVVETQDAVGGGAFPGEALPGFGVGIRPASRGAGSLAHALRTARVPVIPALRDGQVVLHVRTLLGGDESRVAAAFSQALGGEGG
jgi:L-seryl-tRNA(Ser) seleniumtransferase